MTHEDHSQHPLCPECHDNEHLIRTLIGETVDLREEIQELEEVINVLAEWLYTERSSTFRPPANEPDVQGIIAQAIARAMENNNG